MERLVESNFVIASRILQHALPFTVVALMQEGSGMIFVVATLICYATHVLVAKGLVRMPASKLKPWCRLVYVMGTAGAFEMRRTQGPEVAMVQSFHAAGRMVLVVAFVDSRLHIPHQVALSCAEVLFYTMEHGCTQAALALAVGQACLLCVIIALSLMLESYLRDNFTAQFKSADAEVMIRGFRQMLQGVCDGEVLLDGGLRIQGESPSLRRLLMTTAAVDGRSFQELLEDDHQQGSRFQDFIARSAEAVSRQSGATPPCLRVSLQSQSGPRVAVDIFHVVLPGMHGSEAYHLLAFRQDTERENVPDAQPIPEQVFRSLRNASGRRSRPCSARSASSTASRASSTESLLPTFPHLSEMMLLVDASQAQQEVRQVHLTYANASEQAEMPSLRKFIRPTDWETVRSSVKRVASAAAENPSKVMKPVYFKIPLWFRMLDQPSQFMMARGAKLLPHWRSSSPTSPSSSSSRSSGESSEQDPVNQWLARNAANSGQPKEKKPVSLWLCLTDLVAAPVSVRAPAELEMIHEGDHRRLPKDE
ncbi:unnamed protein product [Symbiodinium natans]|uniref:Uncharacterized protein n=1 Tax=Symbiodinium natans TaxID=878477 RepID=A0A812M1H4_9DINO|nr:unnamed protein product [Symbiodinium natans]